MFNSYTSMYTIDLILIVSVCNLITFKPPILEKLDLYKLAR